MSPFSSAMGMNLVRGDDPELGMVPAKKRLLADQPSALQIELRLIVDAEFAPLQSTAEVGFNLQPLERARPSPVGNLAPVFPRLFARYMALSAFR